MSDDVYRQEMDRADWLIDAGQYERAMQILTRLLANYPFVVNNMDTRSYTSYFVCFQS